MRVPSESCLPIELQAIREMTTAMLVAAEKSRWTEVHRIDNARLKLLRTVPAELFSAHDVAVRQLLQEALSATRLIEQKTSDERDRHRNELKHINQRQSAAKAYDFYAAAS